MFTDESRETLDHDMQGLLVQDPFVHQVRLQLHQIVLPIHLEQLLDVQLRGLLSLALHFTPSQLFIIPENDNRSCVNLSIKPTTSQLSLIHQRKYIFINLLRNQS